MSGIAVAIPVYDASLTYLQPAVKVAGEELGNENVKVPVPTVVRNTPRAMLHDADANGVPLAGEAARALPQDDVLVDTNDLVAAAIGAGDDAAALLPDDRLSIRTTRAGSEDARGNLRFYSEAVADHGMYTDPVYGASTGDGSATGIGSTVLNRALPSHAPLARHPSIAPVPHAPIAAPTADGTSAPAATGAPSDGTGGSVATSGTGASVPFAGGAIPDSVRTAAVAAAAVTIPALLGWALYHRIRGHTHLDQATRKSIYDAVCSRPGIGVNDIASTAGVSYSTASYHLDRLTSAGLLVVTGKGPRLRYYKNGGELNERERLIHETFENEAAMRVLAAIRRNPGTYRAELATTLGVTPTTVNWHLRRLLGTGLVAERREGRSAALYLDESALAGAVSTVMSKVAPSAEMDSARALLAPAPA